MRSPRDRSSHDSEHFAPALVVGAALALFCPPVAAEDTATAVRIEVRAQILGYCGFSQPPPADISGLRIDLAQTIALPFVIDCNEPFRIGVASAHGAVLRVGGPSAATFRTARSYETELRVETNDGTMHPRACSSLTLAASAATPCEFAQESAQGLASGERIAVNRPGEIVVRWPDADQDGPRFAPGDYGDVITLRLSRSL